MRDQTCWPTIFTPRELARRSARNLWAHRHLFKIVVFSINFAIDYLGVAQRACLITLHSNFDIFQKGHPAVEFS